MNIRNQRLGVWCGVMFFGAFAAAFFISGFLPPPSANDTAEQIKQVYIDHELRIRAGMLICMLGSVTFIPFVVAISVQLRRIEGNLGMLAWTQMLSGGMAMLTFAFSAMVWQAAAYRPVERSAEAVQTLHDIATLTFVGLPAFAVIQGLAIALGTFQDKRPDPVFPRWVGYFNIWALLLFLPGAVIVYFRTGPFAWDGVFAWWIPAGVFTAWMAVMVTMMLKAITAQERDEFEELATTRPGQVAPAPG